jgi:acyl carrier protein
MNDDNNVKRSDIRAIICRALQDVAPEADLSTLSDSADLREALDIDSMDFLKFVVGLHERLDVDIPEKDYAKVRTLETCVSYVAARSA